MFQKVGSCYCFYRKTKLFYDLISSFCHKTCLCFKGLCQTCFQALLYRLRTTGSWNRRSSETSRSWDCKRCLGLLKKSYRHVMLVLKIMFSLISNVCLFSSSWVCARICPHHVSEIKCPLTLPLTFPQHQGHLCGEIQAMKIMKWFSYSTRKIDKS